MQFQISRETFDAINEDLKLQQEEARNRQLEQQRNQIFNGANDDVYLFESTMDTIKDRVARLQAEIQRLQGECVSGGNSEGGEVQRRLLQATYDKWDTCEWVRSNSNTDGEQNIGYAKNPQQCIEMTRDKCPDASIANMPVSGEGDCWCQYGPEPVADFASDYNSCLL
jgi:uncharacterized small protein (DUF1192 family)